MKQIIGAACLAIAQAACSMDPNDSPDGGVAGVDAGTIAIDLRFRGVGHNWSLSTVDLGLGGGVAPGDGVTTATFMNESLGVAVSSADAFLLSFVTMPRFAEHRTVVSVDGRTCPTTFDAILDQNLVVLAFAGDPASEDGTCTVVTQSPLSGTTRYKPFLRRATLVSDIAADLSVDVTSRSLVVTGIAKETDGYAYIAEQRIISEQAPLEEFDTRAEVASLATLPAVASDLAASGFIITASSWDGGDYTLVGTRPAGTRVAHEAVVKMTDVNEFGPDIAAVLLDGYSVVSLTEGTVPSVGFRFYLVGEK